MLINLLNPVPQWGEKLKSDPEFVSSTGSSRHHQKSITSRWSPLAHACHVWWTSITVIVSYPAHSMTDRMT